jgi:hypothetical protein
VVVIVGVSQCGGSKFKCFAHARNDIFMARQLINGKLENFTIQSFLIGASAAQEDFRVVLIIKFAWWHVSFIREE